MTTITDTSTYRLPRSVLPRRYDLELAPDLEASTFTGTERVEVEITKEVAEIVVNSDELAIGEATVASGWASESGVGPAAALGVRLEQELERAHFVPDSPLAAGHYTLSCSFSGVLNDLLAGFYRSRFVDDEGTEHTIATTQFEETDARKAFPCFDEPDMKAVFGVTLVAPKGTLAVSNGAEVGSETLADGSRRVHFADTVPMSTYLVAFIVGPLESTEWFDADGIGVRVVHVAGKSHLTQMSLDFATHALSYFQRYFDIDYPGTKCDLVGIPDFAQGAMENLGCVTFREADLLADPKATSLPEVSRISEVVEHELAHMWFGDLVTMKWWNGIWLNEAFATFMSFLCHNDAHPEHEPFLVAVTLYWPHAYAVDGLSSTRPIEYPVGPPEEATVMFDALTYYKGGGVLWMIEQYLGHDRFRNGIRRYLKKHAFANAETTDLWDALEEENPDVPVRAVMDSWIFQGGHPLVSVTRKSRKIELRQQPFSYLPASELEGRDSSIGSDWLVPVLAAPIGAPDELSRVILSSDPVVLDEAASPLVVNAGGAGFYNVRYDDDLRGEILARIDELAPVERFNFISDIWATTESGDAGLEGFFDAVSHLSNEKNPYVWVLITGSLRTINSTAADADRPALAAYVRRVLRPQLERIGWERQAADSEQTAYLRGVLLGSLGGVGEDEEVISYCHRLFENDRSPGSEIDADIAANTLNVVAAHASRADFEEIVKRYQHPLSPLDESRYEFSLGSLTDHDFAKEVFAMCRDGRIRSQDAPYLIAYTMRNSVIGPDAFAFVEATFPELESLYPASAIVQMLMLLSELGQLDEDGNPLYLDRVRSFADSRVNDARRRLVDQAIESLEVRIRLARLVRSELGAVLSKH